MIKPHLSVDCTTPLTTSRLVFCLKFFRSLSIRTRIRTVREEEKARTVSYKPTFDQLDLSRSRSACSAYALQTIQHVLAYVPHSLPPLPSTYIHTPSVPSTKVSSPWSLARISLFGSGPRLHLNPPATRLDSGTSTSTSTLYCTAVRHIARVGLNA